jgi:prolyl-tRNA synthetase
MFADMELIGIPHRIVVGEKSLDEGKVEYRGRRDSENSFIPLEKIVSHLQEM